MSIIDHKMKFPAISLAFSIMIYGGIIIYIAENRKTITLDEFNILYALSQTIYAVFGEVQRRANFRPF